MEIKKQENGVSLKRGRMARVERFRKLKRVKKALLTSQELLWGWLKRKRDGELGGAGLAHQEGGRCCVTSSGKHADGVRDVAGSEDGWILLTEHTEGRSETLLLRVRWHGRSFHCENPSLTKRGQCPPAFTPLIPLNAAQERLGTVPGCAPSPWLAHIAGPQGAQHTWRPPHRPWQTWALLRPLCSHPQDLGSIFLL